MAAKGTTTNSGINRKKEKLVTCKHGNKCECVTLSESLDIDTDHERPLSSSHQGVDGHAHIKTPVSPQQDEIASL